MTINTQAEADRAVKELTGKMVQSRPVTIQPLGKPKSTEIARSSEVERRPETDIEAALAAESFLNEFVPDVLRKNTSDSSLDGCQRLGSPPPLSDNQLSEGLGASLAIASVPDDQHESLRLTSSVETRKRKLGELVAFRDEMEDFRKRQREEMDEFHKRQREEMDEFERRQREEIEEKMENWKAETADLERSVKRRKIVLERSAEPDTRSQVPDVPRETEGSADGVDAAETEATDSTNTTYGPHESNLRALSERLGGIDDLKSRQADGETLETSELLEIKTEEQVRLELNREIKSSPGLDPRPTEDVDEDLPLLDSPRVDQTDGTRNVGASSSNLPTADAESAHNETTAAGPDVKMEAAEFGEMVNANANANANGLGASHAEKTTVYIKLENDD